MSEFRGKKKQGTIPKSRGKKQFGGFKDKKYSSTDRINKKRNTSDDREDEDSKSKKPFGKNMPYKKSVKSDDKPTKLASNIKKQFSSFEKKDKVVAFDKKKSKSYSDSKKKFSNDRESDDKPTKLTSNIKKQFSNGPKKDGFVASDKRKSKSYSDSKKRFSDKGNTETVKKTRVSQRPYKKTITRRSSSKKSSTGDAFEGAIRLNRYIAASGMCSRREADELIQLGEVKVNGVVVMEMGVKVNPTDRVEVGGQSISPEKKVYVLLNKPKDFVSTVSDPHADKTVLDLVKLPGQERIYPVGRLDKNTTGVMLLTNDGDLTKKLTHPSYNKKKVYHVVLDKPATKANLQQIIDGFVLEDGFINADAISFVDETTKNEIGIEIHSGRNRIVRRIFEYLGFNVVKLDRVYFAGLTKKNVPRGKWRFLSDKEISILKQGSYE